MSLRREVALLLGQVLDHGLDLVVALLRPRHKPAAGGPAESLRDLLALGHWVGLRGVTDIIVNTDTALVYLRSELLGDSADLPRPLAALLIRHVAALQIQIMFGVTKESLVDT